MKTLRKEQLIPYCFNPSYTGCATGSLFFNACENCPPAVSILLILDVLLEVLYDSISNTHTECFNPSYTGCATGSLDRAALGLGSLIVSILLILDVLLEVL